MSTHTADTSSILESIQEDIAFFLSQKPEFHDIPVLTFLKSNLESRIHSAIESSLGICILVLQPLPKKVIPNLPGPVFEELSIKLRVIENLASNSSTHSALFLAERLSQYLHLLQLPTEGWHSSLSLSEINPWIEIKDPKHPSRNILEISFSAHASLPQI